MPYLGRILDSARSNCAAFQFSYGVAHASSQARSLASAYAREPHRRSDAARAGFGDGGAACSFGDKLFVCDALTASVFDEAVQPIERVALHVAIVQPEREL